nr:immunoglobulin light chain junction region [Macaca mulatta]MOY05670.1 immunoglobulin light chain junction region [Macaca mulatta]MOY06506.1 immunoglobulin light chain junction region [Macaca mulatta]MOY06715.1 immunoglobulin light chain junction region [Macaca mulatta]MOY07910.1 immunoglobulin light chain junction region [Macaca mulatta]
DYYCGIWHSSGYYIF